MNACRRGNHTSGVIILIGGALKDDNSEVWDRVVQAGGGVDQARFGVLTIGSIPPSDDPFVDDPTRCSSSECNGNFYIELLEEYGAKSVEWIPVDLDSKEAAEDEELAARVREYTGFFIGGGDQSRYSEVLQREDGTDTAVLAAMKAAVDAGAGLAGTSAGATIMQAGPMVTGGDSYYSVRDGSRRGYSSNPYQLMYEPDGGFGFFSSGLVDTHFAYRGRQGRMIRLLSDTGTNLGFGIDENTALVASGNTLTALGEHNVHIFDMSSATRSDTRDWGIRTVRWSMLGSGDSYNTATETIHPGDDTENYEGDDNSASLRSYDVFSSANNRSHANNGRASPYEMVELARDYVRSRDSRSASGKTYERSPTYSVSLSVGKGFSAWRNRESQKITFEDIVVDIEAEDDR